MSAFVDKVKLLQEELDSLRRDRGLYISRQQSLEPDKSVADIVADLDRKIIDLTLEIVKLGGPLADPKHQG